MPRAAETNVPTQGLLFSEPSTANPTGSVTNAPDTLQPIFRKLQQISEATVPSHGEPFDPRAVRILNREITRKELLPQRRSIARKRAALFRKTLDNTITPSEVKELRYIEWQLDRIEDAEIGEELDRLTAIAGAHEMLGEKMNTLLEAIRKIKAGRERGARSRGRR